MGRIYTTYFNTKHYNFFFLSSKIAMVFFLFYLALDGDYLTD